MPKPPPGTKRAKLADDGKRRTRLQMLKAQKIVPAMPPDPAPHITGWLMEIGLQEAGAMAAVPLSWREIEAWQASTGIRLQPWEARLIRRLSQDYVTESRLAESETRPPPWRTAPTEQERAAEARLLDDILG